MKIGIQMTLRCNASCTHCSTSCGPLRTESLNREQLYRLMDDALQLAEGEELTVALSGGEPFLDFELLLDVLSHGKSLGATMTCVTNGYWATSEAEAIRVLSEAKNAGLCGLAVSTSRFHREFVKAKRVERVLGASREIGLPCKVKNVRLRSDPEDAKTVEAWAIGAGAVGVQDFPLFPHLRDDAVVAEDEYIRRPGLPTGTCPASLLTVKEDGKAFSCCSPGASSALLEVGNINEDSLDDIHDKYLLGGTQQIVRRYGPIHFAQLAQAQGKGDRLRKSYADVCDLCTHTLSDPVLAAIAAESSAAYEMSQIEQIIGI